MSSEQKVSVEQKCLVKIHMHSINLVGIYKKENIN